MIGRPWLAVAGGLCGAFGVALAAAAAHRGGADMQTAANFLLFHAPAFLAVGLGQRGRRALVGSTWLLVVGVVIFAADLACRDVLGARLFPFAAPLGGMLMIVAWAGIGVSAILEVRRAG